MTLLIEDLCVMANDRLMVEGVSVAVEPGEVTALLGANGAGKSEFVLGVAGMLKVTAGTVNVDGLDLTHQAPNVVRAAGVAVVPEGHRVLTDLSVDENLRAAGAIQKQHLELTLSDIYTLFPELSERKGQLAGTLSGGQQQMVALGHALMCRPKYLLLDEMSLGLAPLIVKRLMVVVEELKQAGTGIVLIEQFTDLALQVSEHAVVLRNGKMQFSGASATLREEPARLDEAYLGAGQ